MHTLEILAVSFWRGVMLLIDEVRRTPTALVAMMLTMVITGTLIALLLHG